MNSYFRFVVCVLSALAVVIIAAVPARAQYQPIPNYIGIGAGQEFRNDINNHLSGVTPVAPRLVGLDFSQLPAEQDGQMYWCKDCQITTPCTGGGSGALALGARGVWSCGTNGLGQLTAPLNANGNLVTDLAPNQAVGDALSQGQSHINDLATATGAYSMGGYPLHGLGAATSAGDALAFGQSSAQLSSAPSAPYVVSYADAAANSGSVTISAPAGVESGDVEFADISWQNDTLAALPAGWTEVGTPECNGSSCVAILWHAAGSSEPSSYTFSFTSPVSYAGGGIADIRGANSTSPIDGSVVGGNTSSGGTVTLAAIAPSQAGDLEFVAGASGAAPSFSRGTVASAFPGGSIGGEGSAAAAFPVFGVSGVSVSVTPTGGQSGLSAEALLIAPASVSGYVATLGNAASFASITGSATDGSNTISGYNVNGTINPVAYGADPTGNFDSTTALQDAVNAACNEADSTSGSYTTPTVRIPPGQFKIGAPIVVSCAHTIRIEGAGARSTLIDAGTGYNFPAFVSIPPNYLSVLTNNTPILATSLVSGPGNSLYFGNTTTNWQMALDYRDAMAAGAGHSATPLNGLSQLDVRYFFELPAGASGEVFPQVSSEGSLTTDNFYGGNGSPDASHAFYAGIYNGAVKGLITTTNGTYIVTDPTPASDSTVYEVELSYDGSELRLIVNGSLVAATAASGAIVQNPYENMTIGDLGWWPDSVDNGTNGQPIGWIDSIQISNIARSACGGSTTVGTNCYTAETSKFTNDSNTLFLCNFDHTMDDGALIQSDDNNSAWMTLLGQTLGAIEDPQDFAHFSIQGGNYGIEISAGTKSRIDDVATSSTGPQSIATFKLFNDSWGTHLDDVFADADYAPFEDTTGSGLDDLIAPRMICGTFCAVAQSGSESFFSPYFDVQNNTAYDLVMMGGGSIYNLAEDTENGGSPIGLYASNITGAPAVLNVWGGSVTSLNSEPAVMVGTSNLQLTFQGVEFSMAGTPAEVIDVLPSSLNIPIMLSDPVINGMPYTQAIASIPMSNQPQSLNVIGADRTDVQAIKVQQVPILASGLNHVVVNKVADPAAPSISVQGATGSTSYGPYYIVCHGPNGGVTNVSPQSNIVTNGPSSLSASDYISISWSAVPGCASYDVLKGNTATLLANTTGTSLNDTGQATTAYTAPTRNTTGDVTVGTMLVSSGISWPLPSTVVNGASFYCPNCDPPSNPPTTCTSSGAKTGSWVNGLNGQWICVP